MCPKYSPILLTGIVACGALFSSPAHARPLVNLTTTGATVADGNAACPDQPYYRYSGGKQDAFAGPAESAYPSPDLVIFMNTPIPSFIADYDVPMVDDKFGDTFNLQNTRSICYALITFRAGPTGPNANNDGLTIGHVESGGSPFTVVAQVINPSGLPQFQTYAFDATGRALLGLMTGTFLDKTPLDSRLDVYLQDDSEIDFIQIHIWYGPNCGEVSPPTC